MAYKCTAKDGTVTHYNNWTEIMEDAEGGVWSSNQSDKIRPAMARKLAQSRPVWLIDVDRQFRPVGWLYQIEKI